MTLVALCDIRGWEKTFVFKAQQHISLCRWENIFPPFFKFKNQQEISACRVCIDHTKSNQNENCTRKAGTALCLSTDRWQHTTKHLQTHFKNLPLFVYQTKRACWCKGDVSHAVSLAFVGAVGFFWWKKSDGVVNKQVSKVTPTPSPSGGEPCMQKTKHGHMALHVHICQKHM